MNKISKGGVKTSKVQEIKIHNTGDQSIDNKINLKNEYKYLLDDHKNIIDVLKDAKNNSNIITDIPFITSSIVVQIQAQFLNCINDPEYSGIESNILVNQIFSLITSIIESIVTGNSVINNRALLYHNIMALFNIHKCNLSDVGCKNMMAFIDYLCDIFIE